MRAVAFTRPTATNKGGHLARLEDAALALVAGRYAALSSGDPLDATDLAFAYTKSSVCALTIC